jgi:septum site-determining protein MinC
MDETNSLIQIKGLRDGLLVSLTDAPWSEQLSVLISRVDAQPSFFQGARLALDVASQVLHVNELVDLRDQLSERGISLWAVLSESPTTEQTSQLLGLATRISKPRPQESVDYGVDDLGKGTALFLNQTLRSGTRIEFAGHVVVLGDVNPGAEIVAEGNIMIWGRLRGMVHAGSDGDEETVICALEFSPMQLRIADDILDVKESPAGSSPQSARIENGKLIIKNWATG